ncbi:MAG: hypothetical protein WCF67_22120, partial [Chitinophagaceae bacterium]
VNDAFSALTPDIDNIYRDATGYNLSSWKTNQAALVTASGAAATAIPFLHLVGIPADVAFLMNRMSVCSFGIGAIICDDNKFGNILEKEDFAIILGRWCNDESLSNAAMSKMAAEVSSKTGNKVLAKQLAKVASKQLGLMVGKKLGGKAGVKLGAKFGAKLGTKAAAGFIPFFGAAVGGTINLYFITQIQTEAESYYRFKITLAKA